MRLIRGPVATILRLHGALAGLATQSQTLELAAWAERSDRGWLAPPARALACSRALRLGIVLVASVALFGLLVPFLTSYPPDHLIPGARLLEPSIAHPLGTDALGRDMLSRLAFGSHLAAQMAIFAVGLSLCVGLLLGSLAGYYGGWLDQLISRTMDGWLALPGALVAIVIVARLGASFENLIVALGLMGVPSFYRIVRSSTMSARRLPFVEAAIAVGATDRRVMWRHVFPNILPPIVVLVTLHMGTAILTGSSLSFIGLGAQPPLPEWGALLAAGRTQFDTAWWLGVFPGAAVAVTVVGLNLLGDGLRDVLDPRFASDAGLAEGQTPSAAVADRATGRRGEPSGVAARALAVLGSEHKG